MSQVLTSKYPLGNYALVGPDGVVDLADDLELMEFLQRISIWEVVVALTHSVDGVFNLNGTYTIVVRSTDVDGTVTNVPSNERDLVKNNESGVFGGRISYSGAGPSGFNYTLYNRFEVTTIAGVETQWKIQCDMLIGDGLQTLTTFDEPTTPDLSAVDFQIYGHAVSLFENAAAGNWTGTITATPTDWWPCAPTSGGAPVFDSATGAQINPNVVID